jgi:hypothetical protein
VEEAVAAHGVLCCGREADGLEDPLNVEPIFVNAFRTHRPGCGTMYCWLLEF